MVEHDVQRLAVVDEQRLEEAAAGGVATARPAPARSERSSLAHIIGTSVSDTTAEMTMVAASVMANSWNSRPTTSPMNSSGISTAISEMVSEMMVKPICSRALERRLHRRVALLEEARDVLDHDDRVVDDEAGRDRQRHQRQIVEAEAELVHDRQRADQRQRHRQARNDRRRNVAQEQEDHQHDERRRPATARTRRRSTEARMVVVRSVSGVMSIAAGSDRGQRRQQLLDAVDHLNDVGAGLALDVDDQRRRLVHPGGEPRRSRRAISTVATSLSSTGAPLR